MDKNKCNCNHHEKGSGNGFLIGLLVGVVLALLITTQKGRKILHELSENGLDALEQQLGSMEDIDEDVVEEEAITNANERPQTEVVRSPARRFFRGVRRKS